MAASGNENATIPELLKFAQEYEATADNPVGQSNLPLVKRPDTANIALRDQVKRQKKIIERMRKEMASLQSRASSESLAKSKETEERQRLAEKALVDVQQMQSKFKEKEERLAALEKQHVIDTGSLKIARQQAEKIKRDSLDAEKTIDSLREQLEKVNQQDNDAFKNRLAQIQKRSNKQTEELMRLRKQLYSLDAAKKLNTNRAEIELNSPAARQAYVFGMSLGQNVLSINQGDEALGMKVADPSFVLAGLRDLLTSKVLMDEQAIEKANIERESLVSKAMKSTIDKQKKQAVTWLTNFKKQPGVKQTSSGLWYFIDYMGDEPLPAGDPVIDISVREDLTDGTTVNDMELNGAVLSMKLSEYPVVFREAISLLRQHGRLTVAVPPDRAYGDRGLPPAIPPGATMVYTIQLESPVE